LEFFFFAATSRFRSAASCSADVARRNSTGDPSDRNKIRVSPLSLPIISPFSALSPLFGDHLTLCPTPYLAFSPVTTAAAQRRSGPRVGYSGIKHTSSHGGRYVGGAARHTKVDATATSAQTIGTEAINRPRALMRSNFPS
jgi:hypothetical protein